MASETVHRCKVCKHEYKTKKEADRCAKTLQETGIKKGDLIFKNHSRLWKVFHMDEGGGLVTLDRVDLWLKLAGWDIHRSHQERAVSYPNANCRGEWKKLSKADLDKHLKRRRMQVAAGEKLLETIGEKSGASPKTVRPRRDKK